MDNLRKKILLDLFITPSTVVPFLVGSSLLILSAMLGGWAAFLGFVGIVLSFGALLTNWVFNLGKISKNAVRQLHRQEEARQKAELDALDAKLVTNKDPRDQSALRNLRTLYGSFCKDLADGKISSNVPPNMLQLIEEIFKECINKLSRSFELWSTSRSLTGDLKDKLLEQRDQMIEDVEQSVLALAETINEVRALKLKTEKGAMDRLRSKLSSQLTVAKKTEESVAALEANDGPSYDEYADIE